MHKKAPKSYIFKVEFPPPPSLSQNRIYLKWKLFSLNNSSSLRKKG